MAHGSYVIILPKELEGTPNILEESYHIPRLVNIRGTRDVQPPIYSVYIGRRMTMGGWDLQASIFANPFKAKDGDISGMVNNYREWVLQQPHIMDRLKDLRDQTLGCWCYPNQCHGDVLIDLYVEKVLGGIRYKIK